MNFPSTPQIGLAISHLEADGLNVYHFHQMAVLDTSICKPSWELWWQSSGWSTYQEPRSTKKNKKFCFVSVTLKEKVSPGVHRYSICSTLRFNHLAHQRRQRRDPTMPFKNLAFPCSWNKCMWLLGSICGFISGTIVVKALILPFPSFTSPPYAPLKPGVTGFLCCGNILQLVFIIPRSLLRRDSVCI